MTRFERCNLIRVNCVVDGDTFWFHGVKIRLAGVDAPETGSPSCSNEQELGIQATSLLVEFLNAGPFDLERSAGSRRDRYGRELFLLKRDQVDLGEQLIGRGLAHRWTGRKQPWCN